MLIKKIYKQIWKRKREIYKKEFVEIAEKYEGVSPENISYLICEKEQEYIVFLDVDKELDWYLTDSGEEKAKKNNFYSILTDIAIISHKPSNMQLSKKQKQQMNCLLGNALVQAIEGRKGAAKKSVEEAENYLVEREYEITRKWFVEFSSLIFGILLILYLIFINKNLGSDAIVQYVKYFCYGAVGVFMSILQNNSNINAKCTAGKALVFCEIFSKFVVGMISSIIAITAFKAGVFMTTLVEESHKKEFILLLGIIAGFSERLVPSLIQQIENEEKYENEKENIDNS